MISLALPEGAWQIFLTDETTGPARGKQKSRFIQATRFFLTKTKARRAAEQSPKDGAGGPTPRRGTIEAADWAVAAA